jgi:DNA-binding transcriptional ArsR family regulator
MLIAIWLYRQMVIYNSRAGRLSSVFHALSDPTRRAILARLVSGEATVSELMEPFQLSQPTISKHLKVLENAGLIEGGRDAQRRPRRLAPAAMKDIADWIEPFRQQWESRFNNLDAHLANIKNREK